MKSSFQFLIFVFFSVVAQAENHQVTLGKVHPVSLKAGRSAIAVVMVTVERNLHLQANPASRPGLIPTSLTVTQNGGISVGRAIYPPGKPYHFPGQPVEISTYQGTFEIRLPLVAAAGAKKGKVQLNAELEAQACNDKICFPPYRTPFTIPVIVSR